MPIVEYPAGAAFPGVIGRTADESSPAWPAPTRAPKGAPNVVFVVLDDTGFGQLGCYGSPIATPNFDALAASGLRYNNMHTTALCSPSRSCIITGRNHHSNGMAAITELAIRLSRATTASSRSRTGCCRRCWSAQGYSTYMVGKWHLTPSNQETAAGPYTRWPLGRGFERFYGFLGGDTSQWYPDLVYDNHQVEPPRTPEEGYHLTEDLVDKSIEFIADAKQVDPDKPFYLHLVLRGHARAAPRAEGVGRQVRGRVRRRLGRLPREGLRAAEGARASCPPTPSCPGTTPTCPTGTSLPPDARRLYSRMMEVFAGFLSHTDHQLGRLLDFLREQGELDNTLIMVISDNGASAEGGPTGTTNEAQFFNNAQEPLEDSLQGHRRDRRPEALQPLPVGLDVGGQHAVPALEARDLPRRRVRPVHRLLAGRHQGQGRGPHAVRPHHRHGADGARPARRRAAGRRSAASPSRRCTGSASRTPSTTPRRPRDHHTQYFEMLGHRAIYHDGWRAVCPWPGPSFAEAGVGFGEPISARDAVPARRHRLGALPRRRGLRRDPRRRGRPPRPAHRDDRHLVRRGRQVRRAADRRQRAGADGRREAAGRACHAISYTYLAEHPVGPVLRGPAGPQPAAQHHRRRRDPRRRRRGRAALPGHRGRRLLAVHQGRAAALRPQLRRPRASTSVSSADPVPRRRSTSCASSSSRPANPTCRNGKGAPGRLQLYVDGNLVGNADAPVTTPFVFNPGALTCGANPGSPVTPDYTSPFQFTGTLHKVVVDVSGELIVGFRRRAADGHGPAIGAAPTTCQLRGSLTLRPLIPII